MNDTTETPESPREILDLPFPERVRRVCRLWASQEQPTPKAVMAAYWVEYLLVFIGVWALFSALASANGDGWAFTNTAFQKAILWALVYESVGLGCGSGPMNGRFWPPLGGFLHFLRPGTIKLPLFPGLPLVGGNRRTVVDALLYAANLAFLLRALVAPEVTPELLLPSVVLLAVLGVTDTTLFLAARGEHYYVALVCLAVAPNDEVWIAACKVLWCSIWFWAATSKLNHHFPSVIAVMMNNGPFFPKALKKRLFASYPDDLRPSAMAARMAHFGTVVEYCIPVILVLSADTPAVTVAGLVLMFAFHGFIAINNPSGMPVEWNILMVYGGVFLFGLRPEVGLTAVTQAPALCVFLAVWGFAIPCYGNFVPSRVSFLLSMRYYAGNWAYNIWLFRDDATKKLDRIVKASATMRQQLEKLLDDADTVDLAVAMSMSHRFMHLEGRPLLEALPRAVDDIDRYEWIDGEVLGGVVLGWNFGDGHLNGERLLAAVQERCGFEPGELRVVSVESQPLLGPAMHWRIFDAADGLIDEGRSEIAPLRDLQPWPGASAEALGRRPG